MSRALRMAPSHKVSTGLEMSQRRHKSAEAILSTLIGSYIPHNDNIPLEHVIIVHKTGRESVDRMLLELYKLVSKVSPYLLLVAI